MSVPSDPLFANQWHLRNTGQDYSESGHDDPGVAGVDLRVVHAWPTATGEGVRVAVLDTGVDLTHPDLHANILAGIGFDGVTGAAGPAGPIYNSDNHGTQVAGVIAAGRNGVEAVGVAYDADIVAYRKFFEPDADADPGVEAPDGYDDDQVTAAILRRQIADGIDVSSNSWGPTLPEPEDSDVAAAIAALATQGRDGLGAPIVFAGGNERFYTVDANAYGDQVDPRTISVAALDHTGALSVFSNAGANILVSAPGESIVTTDRAGSAGENTAAGAAGDDVMVDGTSFAAPAVSGVVALLLEVNPELGARDVQEVLAYSAWAPKNAVNWLADKDVLRQQLQNYEVFQTADQRPDHEDGAGVALLHNDAYLESLSSPVDWQTNGAADWNGGGLGVSHDYGFGLVDARAALRLAETWDTRTGTFSDWTVESLAARAGITVPRTGTPVELSVEVAESDALRLQKAEVTLHLDLPRRISHLDLLNLYDGLDLRLVSPDGTVSVLQHGFSTEAATTLQGIDTKELAAEKGDSANLRLSFLTNMSWGESTGGEWKLQIADTTSSGPALKLASFDIDFYGDRPTADDTYVYTDEYGGVARTDHTRQRLHDSDGGVDTVNFAAVRADLHVRLDGIKGVLDGAAWRTADASSIEHAIAGDGDDFLVGNFRSNKLSGMRGDDSLWGFGGRDRLNGGDGDDHLFGGTSRDRLYGGDGDDRTLGGDGSDLLYGEAGDDRLYGAAGRDRLYGGDGGDRLVGGAEADILRGGAGRDLFIFAAVDDFGDTIADLEIGRGGDVIDLRPMGLGADAEFHLRDDGGSSHLELSADGGGFVLVAQLDHVTGLTLADLEAGRNLLF